VPKAAPSIAGAIGTPQIVGIRIVATKQAMTYCNAATISRFTGNLSLIP